VCEPLAGLTTLAVTDTLVPGVAPVASVTVGEIENCAPDACVVLAVLNVAVRPTCSVFDVVVTTPAEFVARTEYE
jgi:phosphoribosylcarboxyaminoimidazole (NCAIR) mutase